MLILWGSRVIGCAALPSYYFFSSEECRPPFLQLQLLPLRARSPTITHLLSFLAGLGFTCTRCRLRTFHLLMGEPRDSQLFRSSVFDVVCAGKSPSTVILHSSQDLADCDVGSPSDLCICTAQSWLLQVLTGPSSFW